jgi:hypothetical protein
VDSAAEEMQKISNSRSPTGTFAADLGDDPIPVDLLTVNGEDSLPESTIKLLVDV